MSPENLGLLRFREIIASLRDKDKGCPWDLAQTHTSLRPYFLEEVHEFLQSESECNQDQMEEELGDVLLQVYLHARLLEESSQGKITIDTIAHRISEKMIQRHPHVFAREVATDADQVARRWQEIKAESKQGTKHSDAFDKTRGMHGLAGMDAVLKEIKRAGFRFDSPWLALDKVLEEAAEVRECSSDEKKLREELSDLLLATVSTIAEFEMSAEDLMQLARVKLQGRYQAYTEALQERGLDLATMSYEDKESLWEQIKNGS